MATRSRRPSSRAAAAEASAIPETTHASLPTWLMGALVLAAGVLAYANALHGPFVFDDRSALEQNLSIRALGDVGTILRPPADTPLGGRPLVNLTFALNYALGGLRVEGYHAVNITLHLLTALTLLGVLRRTFARTSLGGVVASGADRLALIATLLWTVHPLNTESVNYVTQRTELMLGWFFLLALYAAIRAVDRPAIHWVGLTAIAAVLAGTSKESAVMLPIIVLLWDRTFVYDTVRAAWGQRRAIYVAAAAAWVTFALLASQVSSTRRVVASGDGSRWTYLLSQAEILPRYLGLSVWPRNLIFDYGPMQPVAIGDVLPGFIVVLVLLALTLVAFARRPQLGFWGVWFWVTLAPASSLVPIVTEVGAERRMYLPLIGVICLLLLAATTALRSWITRETTQRAAAWAIGAAVVFALAAVTRARNVDYGSGVTLWETVIERRPTARAHEHLSMFLQDAGRTDEAINHLRVAAPESPQARHALAAALLERGHLAESIDQFRAFVQSNPTDRTIVLARREYATALRRSGDLPAAIEQLRLAVTAAPRDVRNYVELADMLKAAGNIEGAIGVYEDAERIAPRNVVVLSNLGVLLASRGATAAAIPRLRAALDLEPDLTALRQQLVQLLLVTGDFAKAENEARTLIAAAPSNAEAHNLLGVALASQDRLAAARDAFATAVSLDPGFSDARQNLARIESSSPRGQR